MKYTPRPAKHNHNVTEVSPIQELLVLLGGLLAIIIIAYVLLGISADLLVSHISPVSEQKLASILPFNFDTENQQNEKELWLQQLVDTMEENGCATLPYPITVHISDKEIINAMALPGGHIVVFSGLLKIVTSENEMAFVLAHELGHFNNRDHLRGLGRGIVFAFISTMIGSSDGSIARLAGKTLQVTESGFSREQESAADAFALQTLNCVYGHVGGATDFFNHMPKNLDPGHLGHYFASHPENGKRIQALITLQKEKGYAGGPLTPLRKK